MNVLHLTTHINTGGIASYLLTLCGGLTKAGHGVHVISSGGDTREGLVSRGVICVERDIRTKSELSPKIYMALGPVKQYIRDNNIDIIHAHTRVTQVMAFWLNRLCGAPFVATCHGFFKPRFARRVFPCWGRQTIAISEQVADHLTGDFRVPPERLHIIHDGISLADFPVIDPETRAQNRVKLKLGDGPVIGMVARLSDVKGQDILIRSLPKVVEEFPELKVVLIGRGKEKDKLDALVNSLSLAEYVRIIEDQGDVPLYLSVLDVVINPSRMEGLGLSVMEAQASGLPVIASRVGGIPSLIVHGKTGYMVEPQDEGALASMICKVLYNPADARVVGENAAAHARQHYGADLMVEKTLEVYARARKP